MKRVIFSFRNGILSVALTAMLSASTVPAQAGNRNDALGGFIIGFASIVGVGVVAAASSSQRHNLTSGGDVEYAVFRNASDYDGQSTVVRLSGANNAHNIRSHCYNIGTSRCQVIWAGTWEEADRRSGFH